MWNSPERVTRMLLRIANAQERQAAALELIAERLGPTPMVTLESTDWPTVLSKPEPRMTFGEDLHD